MNFRRPHSALFLPVALGTVLATGVARAADAGNGANLVPVLGALVLILVLGKLGGALFARFGQSPVLGELLAGIVIGNLGLAGYHGMEAFRDLPGIDLLAEIGVLFLLFQVGVESDLKKMMAVGGSAFLVAVVGVIAPMGLGYFCSATFFPSHPPLMHWFVGATLSATSVGITARVLSELKGATRTEGRIILGAAVIDDVLGLIVLAVVAGLIKAVDAGSEFQASAVLVIVAKALGFLVGGVLVGRWVSRLTFKYAKSLPGEGVLLSLALAFCFLLAYLSALAGLAPIVGAFTAGLILDEAHYHDLRARDQQNRDVAQLLEPLATFLVPVFFVLMGMRVQLAAFGNVQVLGFAAVLTIAAVAGKQACALGVLEKGADRIAVGLGMIPRGEVGLIFANIGLGLTLGGERVIDGAVFSAVVVMVVLTTLMTPPLLTWRMGSRRRS